MIWLTADWHLWHKNIIKYCNRPFKNVAQMTSILVENYCEIVSEEDTVYFLGDMMLGTSQFFDEKLENVLSSIPGQKHLILGNHDKRSPQRYIDVGFDSVHTELVLTPEPDKQITLIHDPAKARTPNKVYAVGHIHGLWKTLVGQNGQKLFNVGVDVHGFTPVPINSLFNLFEE